MQIRECLSRIRASNEKSDDNKVVIIDGIKYERHTVKSRVLGYPLGEQYYPVAEDNPERFLLIAFLGGIFGIHRFITGEWGKAIFYLLTCGGFGVFYCFDILSILLGTYFIRQVEYEEENGRIDKRVTIVYLDKISKDKKKYAIAAFVLSAVISFFAYSRIYIPLISGCGERAVVKITQDKGEF